MEATTLLASSQTEVPFSTMLFCTLPEKLMVNSERVLSERQKWRENLEIDVTRR
jgi:hypothetical protein